MTGVQVLAAMRVLAEAGIPAWIDGGWGVDALLGRQSRDHADLDLVLDIEQSDAALDALAGDGFTIALDDRPTRVELRASAGQSIDLHPVQFDVEGGGTQLLPGDKQFRYPPAGFYGRGTIAGRSVPCLSAEVQILCHLGYAPDENDRHDVALLCARFDLPLPDEYC